MYTMKSVKDVKWRFKASAAIKHREDNITLYMLFTRQSETLLGNKEYKCLYSCIYKQYTMYY